MNHSVQDIDLNKYSFKSFLPLIAIFLIILILTLIRQFFRGWNIYDALSDFMGFFFLIFGLFKIINLKNFAEAYSEYDLIAKNFKFYGYIYPFIEVSLGILYLIKWNYKLTNIITLLIMGISSLGVAIELSKGKKIVCACLGLVFKLPMTYVTLLEDLLMAIMALIMLIK